MNGPMCCGFPAFKNVISPKLEFWVCKECGEEVKEPTPEQQFQELLDYEAGYPFTVPATLKAPQETDDADIWGF